MTSSSDFYLFHAVDALTKRLISLLASLGADPNVLNTLPILGYIMMPHTCHTVIRHFLITFHPMNLSMRSPSNT